MPTQSRAVILAVDDEPGILASFRLILDDEYEVIEARDGATALEALRSRPVDLILLDLGLPDTSGLALLERIRARDARVPVVIVTIIDRARTAFDAIRLGATDYVTKPFEEVDLQARIRRALTAGNGGDLATLGVRPLSHHVLLIDADVGTRAALTVTLNRDCRVLTVPSLTAAIDEVAPSVPGLVIVRLGALGGNGASGLAALRAYFPESPLILIASPETASRLASDGSRAVIVTEPLEFGTLLAEVAMFLKPVVPEMPRFSTRIARVIQRVACAYPTVTVASLSEGADVSEAQLSRSFHAEFGDTLKSFIVRVRIEAAKSLIRETSAKVDDIANRVGLYDGSHLNRTFARYGIGRPGQFR